MYFSSYLVYYFEFPALSEAVDEVHKKCKLIMFYYTIGKIVAIKQDNDIISSVHRHNIVCLIKWHYMAMNVILLKIYHR